ncbi:hypothetical protein GWO43_02550 [candidate division KSB1 bacterium]|nr:hypothetical protein [candidate division KSB1 bacterium]NIR69746.1 hypothetical protein [candidate division KSB1 bacterium]NIS22934.1 hypothetical protein [candidate division KSB1 bacterium]NIT69791.1 hypothetical protein [candidate division KSB1 bacterium]NIU23465.1 hypothetical protein [candidate division KSB1 bacterium]
MDHIAFYISGHGYGHSTRAVEIINALSKKSPHLHCHIKTDAPKWLFELNVRGNYSFHPISIDIGAVQQTSFHIDKRETLKRWAALLRRRKSIVQAEAAFVKSYGARLILGDITPFAFDIAAEAGVPSVAIANFTWDWIFSHYIDEIPEYSDVVQGIQSSYRKATWLLRLPFRGDLSIFPQVTDIPLIARKAKSSEQEVWKKLELNRERRPNLVLVAFRASDLAEVQLTRAFSNEAFLFITLGLSDSYQNNLNIPPDMIRFTELLNACDLVISKPGYGLVSEVLANKTPLLYTSRADFAEYEKLVAGLKEYAVSEFIPRSEFLKGNWQPYLEQLMKSDKRWKPIPVNGAEVAAEEILGLL